MGWIHDKYMRSGTGFGRGSKPGKRSCPLRKIVGTIWLKSGEYGMEHQYELLECGHRGYMIESINRDLFGPQDAQSRRCCLCRKSE